MEEPRLRDALKAALRQSGVSQYKFAVLAGVNPQTVTRYLAGSTWSAETERKIEAALRILPRRKSTKHRPVRLEEEAP